MKNYKEKITFQKAEVFFYLFDSISPDQLPTKIKEVCSFLNSSLTYANESQDNRIKKWTITTHLSLLNHLHDCAEKMISLPEENHICIRTSSGQLVNLDPFFTFLDAIENSTDTIQDLEELTRVLINYVNETNIWQFKSCVQTIGELHFILNRTIH